MKLQNFIARQKKKRKTKTSDTVASTLLVMSSIQRQELIDLCSGNILRQLSRFYLGLLSCFWNLVLFFGDNVMCGRSSHSVIRLNRSYRYSPKGTATTGTLC